MDDVRRILQRRTEKSVASGCAGDKRKGCVRGVGCYSSGGSN